MSKHFWKYYELFFIQLHIMILYIKQIMVHLITMGMFIFSVQDIKRFVFRWVSKKDLSSSSNLHVLESSTIPYILLLMTIMSSEEIKNKEKERRRRRSRGREEGRKERRKKRRKEKEKKNKQNHTWTYWRLIPNARNF